MNPSPLNLFDNRCIVLFEKPDGFHQVMLTPEMFKKVSDAIVRRVISPATEGDRETVELLLDTDRVLAKSLFEGMWTVDDGQEGVI